ncbi:MAG: aminotransferase class V-fold PLP-dependent enzyme [Clostridiales bacterium]|nr:aminotransferase class V-fold PLP-dependent enzyme [Clostridiales bacterium]
MFAPTLKMTKTIIPILYTQNKIHPFKELINLNDIPIIRGLRKYIDEGVISLHMPGHKNNRRGFEELNWIQDNLYKIDNTEVPGLDNLHMPEEMILEAQMAAARAFKSNRSYFLVNGSTSGIYGMILGVTKPGDKIIVQRNCHKSVFMACLLGDLEAVYLNPTTLEDFNIAVSLRVEDVIKVMDENRDAKAVVLTYPTYYGTCMDLERIAREAHLRNILVLVDEAHGAHSYFSPRLPKGAMECGADLSVTSLHKTIPAMTQTALLNTANIKTEGIEFMLRVFQSTSPSYVFMASIDAARYIMEDRGKQLIDELLDNINIFKEKLSLIPGVKLDEILRKEYGFQVEMSDLNNIVALTSIGNDGESLEGLYNALFEIAMKYGSRENGVESGSLWAGKAAEASFWEMKSLDGVPVPICEADNSDIRNKPMGVQSYNGEVDIGEKVNTAKISMRAAYYSPKIKVKLSEASGMISCEMVSPYPPGIPVLLPGEIITNEIIELIYFYKSRGIHINGLSDKSAEYIEVAMSIQ